MGCLEEQLGARTQGPSPNQKKARTRTPVRQSNTTQNQTHGAGAPLHRQQRPTRTGPSTVRGAGERAEVELREGPVC